LPVDNKVLIRPLSDSEGVWNLVHQYFHQSERSYEYFIFSQVTPTTRISTLSKYMQDQFQRNNLNSIHTVDIQFHSIYDPETILSPNMTLSDIHPTMYYWPNNYLNNKVFTDDETLAGYEIELLQSLYTYSDISINAVIHLLQAIFNRSGISTYPHLVNALLDYVHVSFENDHELPYELDKKKVNYFNGLVHNVFFIKNKSDLYPKGYEMYDQHDVNNPIHYVIYGLKQWTSIYG